MSCDDLDIDHGGRTILPNCPNCPKFISGDAEFSDRDLKHSVDVTYRLPFLPSLLNLIQRNDFLPEITLIEHFAEKQFMNAS